MGKQKKKSFVLTLIVDIFLVLLIVPVIIAVFLALYLAYKLYHPYTKPSKKQKNKAAGMNAVEISIPVFNRNLFLAGLLLHAEEAGDTVIIAHEIGSLKENKLKYASFLNQAGYNVLMIDHRNHGGSAKDKSWWPMSELYTDDIESAIRYVRSQPAMQNGKIAVFAFSFSTYPSLYTIKRPLSQVDAIILDSGPCVKIPPMFKKYLAAFRNSLIPELFNGFLLYGILNLTYVLFGTAMLATTWPPDLSCIKSKVLFIVNEKDTICPPEEVAGIADKIKGSETWIVPGAPHLMALLVARNKYKDKVVAFLNNAFKS